MEFIATQKFVLTSPRKLREAVYLLKGMTPEEAVERLPYATKRASEPLRKVILTAIANARQKEVDVSNLEFKEIQIGEGPRLKRYRAGARGRAKPYKKRMSHIRVVLKTKEMKKRGNEELKNRDKADRKPATLRTQKGTENNDKRTRSSSKSLRRTKSKKGSK